MLHINFISNYPKGHTTSENILLKLSEIELFPYSDAMAKYGAHQAAADGPRNLSISSAGVFP